jgi:hypothetical protein
MNTLTLDELDGRLLDGLGFCRTAYALFESVRSTPGGNERLRLRSGRYISVRWVNGNQSFDAELHQKGDYISQGYYKPVAYLEATCAMHENEHWIWKLLGQGRGVYAP